MPTVVACPTCSKSVEWTPENRWRPFCSKRCKLVDLGAWAAEEYRVPVSEDPDGIGEHDEGEPPGRSDKQ